MRESSIERARLLAWAEQLRRDSAAWRTWSCGRRRKRPCESAALTECKADAMEMEAQT